MAGGDEEALSDEEEAMLALSVVADFGYTTPAQLLTRLTELLTGGAPHLDEAPPTDHWNVHEFKTPVGGKIIHSAPRPQTRARAPLAHPPRSRALLAHPPRSRSARLLLPSHTRHRRAMPAGITEGQTCPTRTAASTAAPTARTARMVG